MTKRQLRATGAALVLLAAGVVVLVVTRRHRTKTLTGPPATLGIAETDDETDVFGGLQSLPDGVSIETEAIAGRDLHYLEIPTWKDHERVDTWLRDHVKLPPRTRVAWGHVGAAAITRSYVVVDPPFVTTRDISDATVTHDAVTKRPALMATLTRDAAQRLEVVTKARTGKRIAVLLDDSVEMAPIVHGPIAGGAFTITLPDSTDERAEGLAAGLRGELLHGP